MTQNSLAQELWDYRWKNRIMLLCEDEKASGQLTEQIGLFADFAEEMDERRLMILLYRHGKLWDVNHKMLGKNVTFPVREGFSGVLLIGLDGSVKWESGFFAEPAEVFRVIDSMPMRRAEIKSKNNP